MKSLPAKTALALALGAMLGAPSGMVYAASVDSTAGGIVELGNTLEDTIHDGTGPTRANILGVTPSGQCSGAECPDWSDLFVVDSAKKVTGVIPNLSTRYGGLEATFVYDGISSEDNSIFAGTNKNDAPIDTYEWKSDPGAPQKDDISNAFFYAKKVGTDLIIAGGFDRKSNDGSSHIDIEFNQSEIKLVDKNGGLIADGSVEHPFETAECLVKNCKFDGQRMEGDILISMNFATGGDFGYVTIFGWNATAQKWDRLIQQPGEGCNLVKGSIPAGSVCAFNNDGLIQAPWVIPPDFPDGLPHNAFTEGVMNISKLLGITNLPCFSTVTVKTRSSAGPTPKIDSATGEYPDDDIHTSELKDFSMGRFALCGIDVTKECEAKLNTAGDKFEVKLQRWLDPDTIYSTVGNTGAVDLNVRLSDTKTTTVDLVASGANSPGCTGVLTTQDVGPNTSFAVGAGLTQCFTGMYEVAPTAAYIVPAGQPHAGEFVFTDTVTATAWEQHIMTPSETNYIDRKMATATCYAPANASISLTKSCDTAILVDGEKAKVTIFGTGENTGDVALKEVKLFDNTIPSISFEALSACLDANGNEACDVGEAILCSGKVDCADGFNANLPAKAKFAYSGWYYSTSPASVTPGNNGQYELAFPDTMKVTAKNLFTDATVDNTAAAECKLVVSKGISVVKDCKLRLNTFTATSNNVAVQADARMDVKNDGTLKLTSVQLTNQATGVNFTIGDLAPAAMSGWKYDMYQVKTIHYANNTGGAATFPSPDGVCANAAHFRDDARVTGTAALLPAAHAAVEATGSAWCNVCQDCDWPGK